MYLLGLDTVPIVENNALSTADMAVDAAKPILSWRLCPGRPKDDKDSLR